MSAETVQKYLSVALWDGVAFQPPRGSVRGRSRGGSLASRDACHHTSAQIPASSMMMLTPVHITISPDGTLPIKPSCGQLCVYVRLVPGRLVPDAQAVQKMNAAISRMR